MCSDVEIADERAFAAEDAAGSSLGGSSNQLPPGVSDISTLSGAAPIGFKAFAPVKVAGGGDFFPSPKFMGARPGYYFSVGALGLGYYIDKNGDPKLFQQATNRSNNVTDVSSSSSVKRRLPPKGPPPQWALEGKSVAPTAS